MIDAPVTLADVLARDTGGVHVAMAANMEPGIELDSYDPIFFLQHNIAWVYDPYMKPDVPTFTLRCDPKLNPCSPPILSLLWPEEPAYVPPMVYYGLFAPQTYYSLATLGGFGGGFGSYSFDSGDEFNMVRYQDGDQFITIFETHTHYDGCPCGCCDNTVPEPVSLPGSVWLLTVPLFLLGMMKRKPRRAGAAHK